MNFERISIGSIIIWEVLSAMAAGLLIWLVLFIFIPYTWLWYLLLWIIGAVYVLAACLYLPLLYYSIEYGIDEKAIIYRTGVFFPNTKILYRDRIAFVSVYHNPFTPILKLSSITVSAAGGNLHIMFLKTGRAKELEYELSRK